MKKLVFFLGIILFFYSFLLSNTIHVPYQYQHIQDGINAASNGDTVLVHNGIYSGFGNTNLIFYGKSIHLKSANGFEHTIIEGGHTNRGISFIYGEGSDTIVEGFSIQNCSDSLYAGGIYCYNSSPTLINNMIYQCEGEDNGGGITLNSSNAMLFGNVIAKNQCPLESTNRSIGKGGGLTIMNSSSPILQYNIIINNYAEIGGALFIDSSSSPALINNTISNNKSNISSGGIVLRNGSSLSCSNSILWGNVGATSDQMVTYTGSTVNVTYSDIEGGYSGTGNISSDPLFVSPSTGAGSTYQIYETDWNLQASSYCIDTADSSMSYDPDNTVRDMGIFYYPHSADFSYDSSFGYVSHTVQFNDESIGDASQWSWDFDSNGSWDAYGAHPSYSYSTAGVYTVTLKIENNSWESTKIKTNIIVIQENELPKPENLTITMGAGTATLNWDEVIGSGYYLIYVSNDPAGEFIYMDTVTNTNYTTGDISAFDKLFFKIIGFDGTRNELDNFIKNKRVIK